MTQKGQRAPFGYASSTVFDDSLGVDDRGPIPSHQAGPDRRMHSRSEERFGVWECVFRPGLAIFAHLVARGPGRNTEENRPGHERHPR